MLAATILVIVTAVNQGSVVTFQEFNSPAACAKARALIESAEPAWRRPLVTACVPK